jgi:microcystin-dependent protein
MPYIVNFTDRENKTPITVFDNTSSQDTSLTFPGRNVTGYGQIIAENFLAVLENFASPNQPVNPVEGQLWYDTTNGVLQLFDNTNWKAASNIQKGPTEPSVETSKVGELWVDTTNQQLRIYTGTRWLLVGPTESAIDGLRYGPAVEKIVDQDNLDKNVLILYIADQPVVIVSKDSFVPKIDIQGFTNIKSGINIATPASGEEDAFASIFLGGNLPKLIGTAKNADALNVGDTEVAAGKFLRTDTVNTTEFGLNVRNNGGITIGNDGNFQLTTSATAAKVYNSAAGSSLDLQVNRNGVPSTILRVLDNKVGINVAAPDNALDVDGDIGVTGALIVADDNQSINLNTGSIRTAGGVAITKNLKVGTELQVFGRTALSDVQPNANESYDLGTDTLRWNNIKAKKIIADEIEGTISGNITGNANTATNLKNLTTFKIVGDVISDTLQFDGQVGSYTKEFTTQLTANIIKSKDEPLPLVSEENDQILVYRATAEVGGSTGLLKQDRDTFVGDLGIPIGTVLPFAGPNVPYGFLLCDGGEVEIAKFRKLHDVIGSRYNGAGALNGAVGKTFRVPDLRGRFALGRHNMDNNIEVPNDVGGFVDNGGGSPVPARISGTEPETLAASSGASSVQLELANLPEHSHNMQGDSEQFYSIKVTTTPTASSTSLQGPTGATQPAQYLPDSGGVKKPTGTTLSSPVGIMNPYLTINYIIRSGPAEF